MTIRRVPALFAVCCALIPTALPAQSVRIGVDGLRDDIPATRLSWSVQTTLQPLRPVHITVGMRDLRVEQEPFQGMERYEESLQTGYAEAAVLLGQRAAISGRAALNRSADGATDGEYLVRGQYAVPVGSVPHLLATTFTVEAARARELSVATAIAERITYERLAGGLDLRFRERASVAAHFSRSRYSDANRKIEAYAYGLLHLVNRPTVSLGYAYAFADSDVDHWRATGSTYDPASQTYQYRYFYYPYFTPVEERGHMALSSLNWSSRSGITLAASVNVPVHSDGMLQATPRGGSTAQPPGYGYYPTTGILPLQARAHVVLPVASWLTGSVRYDYFSKPYYSYHAGGVGLQLNF